MKAFKKKNTTLSPRSAANAVKNSSAVQLQDNRKSSGAVIQLAGRNHADRIYRVTVSASWPINGVMHHEPAGTYNFPYTSDEHPTAPLEREAKRMYRATHPNVPNGGPQMRMNVHGRALQG